LLIQDHVAVGYPIGNGGSTNTDRPCRTYQVDKAWLSS